MERYLAQNTGGASGTPQKCHLPNNQTVITARDTLVDTMEFSRIIAQIEDQMAPRLKLDVGEARLYYHLLRHSRVLDKDDVLISVAQLAEVLNCSKSTVKPRLRTLQDKGVIQVMNTGWAGTRLRVFLPIEIPGALPEESAVAVLDIEAIDFYKDSRYRAAIFEREHGRCFYCRRALSDEDAGLDHAEPQIANGANSYRNVVAACHACNSSKGGDNADEFIRKL